ncbi:MAG: hypothetical protein JSS76_01600 [Bacteroidetes bacterium]|nr:hypothetical protein [Bacteroidota bacterium]
MKKIAIILGIIATVSLGSCKKDWTCSCTDQSGNNTYHTVPNATISDAKKTCNGYESHVSSSIYNNCSIE